MIEADEVRIGIRESCFRLKGASGVDDALLQIKIIHNYLSTSSLISSEIEADVQSEILDTLVEIVSEPSLWTVKAPTTDDTLDSSVIPSLPNELVLEITEILTNVTTDNALQPQAMVKAGALPMLAKLLERYETADTEDAVTIKERSVWALGNIIVDSPKFCNLAIATGAVERMIQLLQRFTTMEHLALDQGQSFLLSRSLWALGNIFRYDAPQTGIEIARRINSLMHELVLMDSIKEETYVLCTICRTTSYIAGCGPTYIQISVDSGMVSSTMSLFYDERELVNTAALWAVANFAKSSLWLKSLLLHRWPDLVDKVSSRISITEIYMDPRIIPREITFMINFTTECQLEHVQAVIYSSALPTLIKIGRTWTDTSRQWSIAQVFSNILAVSQSAEIDVLMNSDQFPRVIVKLLRIPKSSFKKSLLDGILKILESAENMSSSISDMEGNLDSDSSIVQSKRVQNRRPDNPGEKLVRYIRAFRAVELPQRIRIPMRNFWVEQARCELKLRFFDFYKVPDLEQ